MLDDVKVGDIVTRNIAGLPMMLKVSEVTDELIHCGPWKFRKDTGGEVDEDLGWDGVTLTGSILCFPSEEEPCPSDT
jgi:hypothetical protein